MVAFLSVQDRIVIALLQYGVLSLHDKGEPTEHRGLKEKNM